MTERQPVLRFDKLNVWYGQGRSELHVLRNLSLNLMPGERLGLVGESGSGKTTAILAAMGLLPSSATVSGRIWLNGKDILAGGDATVSPHRWKDIAMVFQGAMNAFNPVKTIGWQISEALEVHGLGKGNAGLMRAEDLLKLVDIPAGSTRLFPHQFSGGMRQRAMIAMALACNPKVLLADEPTTALDVMVQEQVLKLLVRLSQELDLAVILVTHDLGVVAEACDRAAVMLRGELVEQAPMSSLYNNPQHPYTIKLFNATPRLTALKEREAPSAPAAQKPLLEVDNLHVTYQGNRSLADLMLRREPSEKQAVCGATLQVNSGEFVALVGKSGSGKTSILQTILGMQSASSGTIRLKGREVSSLPARKWGPLRRSVQIIYQDPYESLDGRYRVRDIVGEPLNIHGIHPGRKERDMAICAAIEAVGLTPASRFLNRFPHELSGGQRQRVAIAASLILQPDLLLADEPVSMLDVSVRTGILDLLSKLCRENHMGVLMITHDLSTAALYADRVAVMHDGQIVEQGLTAQVIEAPQNTYTKRLLASIPNPNPDARRII